MLCNGGTILNGIEMDIGWKSELSDEMKKNGLTIDNPLKLVGASQFFKKHGFNVLMTFSSYKEMEAAIASQKKAVGRFEGKDSCG